MEFSHSILEVLLEMLLGFYLCFERKITQDFLCVENKEDAGVPVYIEIHKRNKRREHKFYSYFYKIQIQVPIHMCALHSLPPLGRSNLGDLVFWFPEPRKAPG